MPNRYLLAAEADKIQDFLFRSAHLREVVGGSQLLVRFCKETPGLLGVPQADLVVHAGGAFRVLFDEEQAAQDFGAALAELYRQAADGTLTVAQPVPVTQTYGEAGAHAEEELRRAKRRYTGFAASPQMPFIAFCGTCGVGLAAAHSLRHSRDTRPQYLCRACQAKAAERDDERTAGAFLADFYAEVSGGADPDTLHWPGREVRSDTQISDPVEDVADYDRRRYVAYLVADGNGMGEIFGLCRTEEQVRHLSLGLDTVVRRALAQPTILAMRHAVRSGMRTDTGLIPVLPLIMGGDDIFALIPAPWAIDFAARFCRAYETGMAELLAKPIFADLHAEYAARRTEAPSRLQPTMAAAVVVCKASHPYALAHAAGHHRLKEAKQLARLLAHEAPAAPSSVVNFEVILGGELEPATSYRAWRPTLRPYWLGDVPAGWGITVASLLAQRWELRNISGKRLAQLRGLFDPAALPDSSDDASQEKWKRRLRYLEGRISRRPKEGEAVAGALAALGGESPAPWYRVTYDGSMNWWGHGLPDLLEAWEFTYNLEQDRASYETEV